MPLLSDAQVRAALAKADVARVYLLVGDDEVGKTALLEALSGLIEPDLQAFNLERIYANEHPLDAVVGAARTLPLLGTRRVVMALRCEVFLKPRRKAAATEGEDGEDGESTPEADVPTGATADLERYLASPSPETVLVLVASDMARNTRIAKALLKAATVIEYWGLKSDRDAKGRDLEQALRAGERFIRDGVREAGFRIRPDAIEPLLAHAGTDISVLRNALERLTTYCAGRPEIGLDDVRAIVSGAVQLDEWALTRAIQAGDAREALRHLHLGFEAGQSPWMLLGQLGWFVRTRLAEQSAARVPRAIEALFRADLALKSSGGDPQVLLERLVVELCGSQERRASTARPWRS